jgi:phage tail tape-measure protein
MERIIIDVTSDPTKLQATIDQLEKLGKVDNDNAASFKRNNDQTISQIDKLKASLVSLERQRDQANSMEKMVRFQKMIDNQKSAIDRLTESERKRAEEEKKSIGIIENLTRRINQLKEARDKANDPSKIVRYNQMIAEAERRHGNLTGQVRNLGSQTTWLQGKMQGLGTAILGVFAVERLFSFAKEMVNVRAEFQKFEAQLTTALGSQSQAQIAMQRITDFAANTPFTVKELTESFVRLANRGINASNDQLTKLGDVASALGKPMSSVIEAILDINNTERWNELGIKVKTNGDKITGTFKGMTVTMDRTEQGAMKMIEAFGGMETVAGGMERQMQTLGGAMSNLDDNWTNLMNNMGKTSEGVFNYIIGGLNKLLGGLNAYVGSLNQVDETLTKMGQSQLKSQQTFGTAMSMNIITGPYQMYKLIKDMGYNKELQAQQENLNKILGGNFKLKEQE